MTEVRTHQSGRLDDVSPLDLLQSLGIYRRTGHVVFLHPYGRSQLWFEAGAIVDAESGALQGAAALYRIVTHERGEYLLEVTGEPHVHTIERSSSALVFEAARRLDESQRLRDRLPSTEAVLVRGEGAAIDGATDEHARVAVLFEAGVTLGELLERSGLGELETLQWVAELFDAGQVRATTALRAPPSPVLDEPGSWPLEASQSFVPTPSYGPHDGLDAAPASRRRWWVHASVGAAVTAALTLVVVHGRADGSTISSMEGIASPMAGGGPAVMIGATNPSPGSRERTLAVGAVAMVQVPPSHGEPTTVASPPGAVLAQKRRAGREPSRPSRARAEPERAVMPEPRTEPPIVPADAASLLAEARRAYAAGQGATAYRLAARSQKLRPSGEAAEVMTLAACQQKRADAANDALRGVPLMRRAHVRSGCRQAHGVRLKLARSSR
jgi:hypothetical protein